MIFQKNLSADKNNYLTISNISVKKLVAKYGSPLYILDENVIINNCLKFQNIMQKYFGVKRGIVAYASKAFCTKYIYKLLNNIGLFADVVSYGEIYTAYNANFCMNNLYFHGNNKTTEELELALKHKIGYIVLDNLNEAIMINKIAKKLNIKQKVFIRVKPGIDIHTHKYITTGNLDSKFGVSIEDNEIFLFCNILKNMSNIELIGLHCHIGSQIFDVQPFLDSSLIMMKIIKKLKDYFNINIKQLNLGGGFAIKYKHNDIPPSIETIIKKIAEIINTKSAEYNIQLSKVIIEPGRSIIGEAGITAYKVGNIKKIKNIKTYVSIDGGMTDNPRYALYQSKYTFISAENVNYDQNYKYTIAGKCCESGDLLGENISLPKLKIGDIICCLSTGAYNYSMSSNYNRIIKPAVVLVNNGFHKIIIQRETYEDIIRNDLI